MNILYEDSMPYADAFFAGLGSCRSFSHRTLCPEDLIDTDFLLVRSTTKVNQTLLAKAERLKFVSTATSGTNHMDLSLLKSRGIDYNSAAGCNATAVAEYILSVLFATNKDLPGALLDKTVGIVGAGHVGSMLAKKLDVLGIRYKLCDPPLKMAGDKRSLVSLDEVFNCEVVTFHTPLVDAGDFPTRHLVGRDRLEGLREEQLLINASRGEVVDNQAALALFEQGKKMNLVLDVWENEPHINLALVPYVLLGTAHIAGHTIEGKVRGTEMLYQQVSSRIGISPTRTLEDFVAPPGQPVLKLNSDLSPTEQIANLVHQVYDVRKDDKEFKARVMEAGQFEYIRKHYAIRREFTALQVKAGNSAVTEAIYGLGFNS